MAHYQTCVLCGAEGPQVRIALVEWLDPEPADSSDHAMRPRYVPIRFSSIPRCADTADCRQRVEQLGESWPLTAPRAVS